MKEVFIPIVENFKLLASNEQKTFEVNNLMTLDQEFISDQDKIEKITYNLLSNAFKYCGVPGYIKMNVSIQHQKLLMQIENDGKGISNDQRKIVFDRFAQLNNAYKWKPGSGVGLEYTKKLVEALNGKISFRSGEKRMTCFTVSIPLHEPVKGVQFNNSADLRDDFDAIKPEIRKDISILLIEDDCDINDYLSEILSAYYNVLREYDGRRGLDIIKEKKPDMVITDILLPGINGIKICKRIKQSSTFNQIPVLLLTSLKEPEYVAEGTFAGADGYIYKPFPEDLFLAKVHTILKNTLALREKYQKTISLQPTIEQDTDEKAEFLRKILSLIEENIHIQGFGAGDLANKLNVSRGTLYNKVNEYADQPVKELINDIRLKRAKDLLKQNHATVSEIAYRVGFNEPKHFSRLFKKKFGQSPSEYRIAD
jgi:DNA-binding response OmpR family regulator/anti-sigma regulatory factor (Ser/Thr protein kinase)